MKIEYVPMAQFSKERYFTWESKGCSGTWLSIESAVEWLECGVHHVPETGPKIGTLVGAIWWCRQMWEEEFEEGVYSCPEEEPITQRYFQKKYFASVSVEAMEIFSNPYMKAVYADIKGGARSLEHIAANAAIETLRFEEDEKTGIPPVYGDLSVVSWMDSEGLPIHDIQGIVYAHPKNKATYIVAHDGWDLVLWAEKTSHIFQEG